MLGDNAAVHLKQLADGLLCQPDVAVLHPYLDAIGVGVFGKDQKVRGAVADFKFIVMLHPYFPLLVFLHKSKSVMDYDTQSLSSFVNQPNGSYDLTVVLKVGLFSAAHLVFHP